MAHKKCTECKSEERKKGICTVPLAAAEGEAIRQGHTIQLLIWVITLLIVLLVCSNAAWIAVEVMK